MDSSLFTQGLIIGFSIAAPVGPIGALCVRRTLAEGRATGLLTGLGAATADALYGAIAAFGLTAVSDFLIAEQAWTRLAGGVFLVLLGVRTLLAEPSAGPAGSSSANLARAYLSTLFLTLSNPMTILSFGFVFAGMGVGGPKGNSGAAAVVLGVFLGSSFWWLLLSGGVSLFRNRFNLAGMRWVNRISGLVILGFGLFLLLRP